MSDYLDVLVLCSDPIDVRRTLNLGHELVHLERVIRRSELPIRLRRVFPPTLDQLRREFAQAVALNRQPSIFHFLGHGDDDGLYFETEHGESQLVNGHELRKVLGASPVKLVLLNACWSATKRGVSLCEFLTREQVAGAAIGHEQPVADASAIEFAKQLYTWITQGQTIREACQRGENSLAEQGKVGASEVSLVGNGDLVLTDGLASRSLPCVIEFGLPRFGYLPEPPVFYGRGEELLQLSQSLADADLTGFGLWGIGGIGKTALAKVAARRNAWRYDGAVWVDLRDATQTTTSELLRLALCRLHPGAPDDDPVFELTRRMQHTPSLVVLDNLEGLAESEHATLTRFLQQVPKNGSRVLLIARVALAAIERMPDIRTRRMIDGLDTWNGAHYVHHVACQKQCLALNEELREEGTTLEGLCVLVSQRLHGHPKMLELVVGVALLGREKLEQALISMPKDIEQQLTAMLTTSLHFLGDDGNRVLPLLAFFPTGSMTPEALQVVGRAVGDLARQNDHLSVTGILPVEPPASAGVVDMRKSENDVNLSEDDVEPEEAEPDFTWLDRGRQQLFAAGLLEYDQAHDVFNFHQSVLDEAVRRLPNDEAMGSASVALLIHYFRYTQANHDDNRRLDRCFENIVVLMESLWSMRDSDGPVDSVLADMTDSLGNYIRDRGLCRLGEQWHDRVIELRRTSIHAQNDESLALQLFHQGQVLITLGRPAEARQMLDESISLFEQGGIQEGVSLALNELAKIETLHGDPSDARRLLQRSLAIDESLGNQRGLSLSLHTMGVIETTQGNLSEARRLLQRSLAIFESLGDQRGLSTSLFQLAIIESEQGNPSEARRLLRRSLSIYESLEDQRGLSTSLLELAKIESKQGNPSEARRLSQRSLAIYESLGDQRGLSESLHQSATIELMQGNPSEARRLLERSVAINESVGNRRGLSASLNQLANIEFEQGNRIEARRLLERTVANYESLGDQRGLSTSLHELARIESSDGNSSEARRLLERSLSIYESQGNQHGLSVSLHQLASIEYEQGNMSEARRMLERSMEISESQGEQRVLSASLHQLAHIEFKEGNRSEARRLWERSIRMQESIGHVAGAAAAKSMLAQLEAIDGRFERAIELAGEAVRDLEQLGYATADQAREILRDVERSAAQSRSPTDLGETNLAAAMELIEEGDLIAAKLRLEQGLAYALAKGDPLYAATCQIELGRIFLKSDQPAKAVGAFQEALELVTQADETEFITAAQQLLTLAKRAVGGT